MSKILANQIANYGDNSPVEVKEGVNIPAGKPLQAAGNAGTSGQVLTATPTSIEWATPFDGSYLSLTNTPTIPAAQVNADWNASGGSVAAILNKPVIPAQPSVVLAAAGTTTLAYNQANGEFTFTPPDLSGLAANTNVANWDTAYGWGDHAQAGYAATVNAANWDVAYGWGDHGVAGYLTAEADTLQTVMARGATTSVKIIANGGVRADVLGVGGGIGNGDVQLQHNDISNVSTLGHYNINGSFEITSVSKINLKPGSESGNSVDIYHNIDGSTETLRIQTTDTGVDISGNLDVTGTVSGIDIEDLDNVNIAGGLQDQQVLKWESSSSSWKPANDLVGGASGIQFGDLSVIENAAGTAALSYNNTNGVFTYTPPDLTSYLTTETDPVFSAHVSSGILQTNINQWTSAYGWGDHSTAGYLTSYSETGTLADVTGRGATTSSDLTFNGTTNLNSTIQIADNVVANFGASQDGRIAYVDSTNRFIVRCPGGGADLILGAGPAIRITNENGLTDRAVFTASGATISGDITTTGKVYFSNNFATLGDLPNATTYHGMFAHVHAENHGYFAHAGAWTQLIDTGSNLSELADVATTAPSTSDVLTWDGANWGPATPTGGGGGANVTISDTAPGSASAGDLWWESDKGRLKIYYNDTDSTQWVDASPPLTNVNVPVAVGYIFLDGTAPTWTGTSGYTVSGTQPGGVGTDYVITLTFPTAYSARTDYIVQATYDSTGFVSGNGASIGVVRGTSSVVFTPRRWNEDPLSLGEIMITITNL